MDLREITMTNFVLLRDTWTRTNCLELLVQLQPLRVVIVQERAQDQYYLLETSSLFQLLINTTDTAFLADLVKTGRYALVPALESSSEANDAPDQCVVLEGGYPIGFFDASIPPDLGVTRGIQENSREPDVPLLSLVVDVPAHVSLDGIVSVHVLLTTEDHLEGSAALSLDLPVGVVIDILLQAGQGLTFEGETEGQLIVSPQNEDQTLQFRLRGLESGLRQFTVLAFHKRRRLGFLTIRILVLSVSERVGTANQSDVHPLQPLEADYPGLSLLTFERNVLGKAEITPPLTSQNNAVERSTAISAPEILWEGCQPGQLVSGLAEQQGDRGIATPSEQQLVDELRDLLGRLFADAKSILVETLAPGFSGAKVLKVSPFLDEQGGGRPFVVKFGDVHALANEYTNYKKYIYYFVKDGRNTSADRYERTVHLGGILYSFVGAHVQRIRDFGKIYQQSNLSEVKVILDNVFRSTCAPWYANIGQLRPVNLTDAYEWQDMEKLKEYEYTILKIVPVVSFKQKLLFKTFKKEPARSFPNPFHALSSGKIFTRPTYVSITHGDLNQNNILVDRTNYAWLIDFQHVGRSHILRDVATLDTVIRFQLLFAHQATLEEFLAMEEALYAAQYFSQLEDLQKSFRTDNAALTKTYQTVLHLRTLAHWMIEKNTDDMSEYYIALLYLTLNTLEYSSLEVEQREHALLSASLLVDLLGLVEG